jgi:hypothetical protein
VVGLVGSASKESVNPLFLETCDTHEPNAYPQDPNTMYLLAHLTHVDFPFLAAAFGLGVATGALVGFAFFRWRMP